VKLFRVSVVVVIALSGLMLTACATGPVGPRGATGAQGPVGKTGTTGAMGPQGPSGSDGSTGTTGVKGASGPSGAAGAAGGAGSADAPQYAYIYNVAFENLPAQSGLTFSDNGDMTSGIVHVPSTADVIVNVAGEYEVSFTVMGGSFNQFVLDRNGLRVPGTVFGSGGNDVPTGGTTILSMSAGDTLTVLYNGLGGIIGLGGNLGGPSTITNASLAIHKIG
jgi:Collagen triple helix repeat (20 copies)